MSETESVTVTMPYQDRAVLDVLSEMTHDGSGAGNGTVRSDPSACGLVYQFRQAAVFSATGDSTEPTTGGKVHDL